jgi:hypothetical protein
MDHHAFAGPVGDPQEGQNVSSERLFWRRVISDTVEAQIELIDVP